MEGRKTRSRSARSQGGTREKGHIGPKHQQLTTPNNCTAWIQGFVPLAFTAAYTTPPSHIHTASIRSCHDDGDDDGDGDGDDGGDEGLVMMGTMVVMVMVMGRWWRW